MAETLGMPTLTITIKKAAQTVVARLKDGVVAMIVRDATETPGLYVVGDKTDIPSKLAANTAKSVERALIGGIRRPQKVLLSVIGASDDLVTKGAAALASSDFDYLAAPDDVDEEEMEALVDWLDGIRAKYSVGKLMAPAFKVRSFISASMALRFSGSVSAARSSYLAMISLYMGSSCVQSNAPIWLVPLNMTCSK